MNEKTVLHSLQLAPEVHAVINAINMDFSGKPITLDSLIDQFVQLRNTFRQINPRCASVLIVEILGTVSVRAVIPPSSNGALFGLQDFHGNQTNTSSQTVHSASNETHSNPTSETIEATALRNAEYLAAEVRATSLKSVDVGNDVATRAEQGIIDAEDLPQLLAPAPDPRTSRATYALARGPEWEVDYSTTTRTIGGNRQIPANLHSRTVFSLRGCRLEPTNNAHLFTIRGSRDDAAWTDLIRAFPNCMNLHVAEESPELPFVTEAVLRDVLIDLDVCVADRVGTGKRFAVPLRVRNRDAVIDSLASRLQLLTELAAN